MAVAAVAGLASIGGQALGAYFAGTAFTMGMAAASFAIGAGMSMVSRALMPKPQSGLQMEGLQQTVKNAVSSRKIVYGEMRTGGTLVYINTSGTDNKYLHLVVAFASHEIESFEKIYLNEKIAWNNGVYDSHFQNKVGFYFHKGDQTTADSELNSTFVTWTDNHKLLDIAYVHARLEWDADVFQNGIPNISAQIKGKKVYDPRTGLTAFSSNPALCLYDYMRDTKFGLGEPAANFDAQSVIDAANICDQTSTQFTGVRYKLDGVVDTGNKVKDNIEAMTTAMGGHVAFSGGKFFIYAGEFRTPLADVFDESHLVGDIQLQTKQSRRSLYNAVKGVFVSAGDDYIATDYPAQISSQYSIEDGDPIYLDMPLPFTTDQERAQRLAKVALLRSRQQKVITMPMNMAALKFKAGDVIKVTNEKLGFSEKLFEVLGYDIRVGEQIIVDVQAIETDSGLYDWTTSDAQPYEFKGEIPTYDGTPVAPTSLQLTGYTYLQADGTHTLYIDAAWTASVDAFIDFYRFKYTVDGKTVSVDTRDTSHRILATSGSEYTISVSAINLLARESSVIAGTITPVTDTEAPDAPTGVSATGGLRAVGIEWSNPSQSDFKHVEIYVSTTSTPAPTEATEATLKIDGERFVAGGLNYNDTRYFWLRSVDFTGNKSAWTSVVSATAQAVPNDGNWVDAAGAAAAAPVQSVNGMTGEVEIDPVYSAGVYFITTNDNLAPSAAEFLAVAGRDAIANDFVFATDTTTTPESKYGWRYDGALWVSVTNLIDGDLIVSGSIGSDKLVANSIDTGQLVVGVQTSLSNADSALQDGDTGVGLGLTSGSAGGITITSSKLYSGAGTFNNSNTGFYLSSDGDFSLGNKLSFDYSASELQVNGKAVFSSLVVDGGDDPSKSVGIYAKGLKGAAVLAENFSADAWAAIDARISAGSGTTTSTTYTGYTDSASTSAISGSGAWTVTVNNGGSGYTKGVNPVEISGSFNLNWDEPNADAVGQTVTLQLQRRTVGGAWGNIGSAVTSAIQNYVYYNQYYYWVQSAISISDTTGTTDTAYEYRLYVSLSAGSVDNDNGNSMSIEIYEAAGAGGVAAQTADKWTTARTLTIGSTGKSVDGSANVSWTLGEIGAAAASHSHSYLPLSGGSITGAIDANGDAVGFRFDGRAFSWNSAMQSPTTKVPHIMQDTYSGWDPVIGIKTTNGFFQFGAYSSDTLHLGYMAGAFGSHSTNSFDKSFTFNKDGNFTADGSISAASLSTTGNASAGSITATGGGDINLSTNGTDTGDIVWSDVSGEKHRLWDSGSNLQYRYRAGVGYELIHAGNIGSQSVSYATSAGSAASASNADTVDNYHASTTAGSANTIPVRDANGYLSNTWFHSTRGVESTAANSYLYDTGDGYMRKKSLLNARKEILNGYVVARYITSAGASGRLTIRLPFTFSSNIMIKFTISGYGQYDQWTYEFSGYLYSSINNWYSPRAVFTGTGSPDIICGRDASGYAYVSIPKYNYMGVTVSNVTVGYIASEDNAYNTGWTITNDSYSSNQASINVLHAYPDRSNWGNTASAFDRVVGQLAWKNYGNSHTIYDASSSVTPSGTTKGNTDPEVRWSATYPTLMGWNGTNTYGVRVDRSKDSERVCTTGGDVRLTALSDSNASFVVNGGYKNLYAYNDSGGVGWSTGQGSSYNTLHYMEHGTAHNFYIGAVNKARLTASGFEVRTQTYNGILGSASFSWNGSTQYPTLYGSSADRWVMHINPHICYAQNGSRGYTGSTYGSMIRFEGNSAGSSYWDCGVLPQSVGADAWAVSRQNTTWMMYLNGSGDMYVNNDVRSNGYRGRNNIGGTGEASWHPAGIYSGSTQWLYGHTYRNGSGTSNSGSINFYQSSDRRYGLIGDYSPYTHAAIWAMGSAYQISSDGTSGGSLYGLAYGYNPSYGSCAQAVEGLDHQMIWMQNGSKTAAIGKGIWTSGDVTAFSDIRVKTNIKKIDDALDKVCKINGYTFERTDQDKIDPATGEMPKRRRHAGVIAQEVMEVLPEVILGDDDSMYSVAYGNMVALLIEAVKEQQDQIDELKQLTRKLLEK